MVARIEGGLRLPPCQGQPQLLGVQRSLGAVLARVVEREYREVVATPCSLVKQPTDSSRPKT